MHIGIVGNGVTAVTALREILKLDPESKIEVFTSEPYGYYIRPKLIEFLAGRIDEQSIVQFGSDWYSRKNALLHLSTQVVGIDPKEMAIQTQDQIYDGFDRILISTGSRPFVPPIPGTDKIGMFVLRTLNDAKSIKAAISPSKKVFIVGGGILGIEIAAAVASTGGAPTVISNIDRLLPAQLDEIASSLLVDLLQQMGISFEFNYLCAEILGQEEVTGVISTEGKPLDGEIVIAATGVRPNMDVAKSADIACDRGITVDSHMQTSADGIFAAGDCAEWNGICGGIIPRAVETAKVAAHNMIDFGTRVYNGTIPSNILKVAGIDLFSIGEVTPPSKEFDVATRLDADRGRYYKAVLKDNVIVGAIILGDRKMALRIQKLVRSGETVDDQSLFSQ